MQKTHSKRAGVVATDAEPAFRADRDGGGGGRGVQDGADNERSAPPGGTTQEIRFVSGSIIPIKS